MSTGARRFGTTAGTAVLVRFMLRRERRALPWWLLGATVLFAYQSVGSQGIYDTPEKLANLRETMGGNSAVVAMSGPARLLDTIGGEVVFEIFAYLGIVVALMSMFLVGRHTRSDEETGRAELVRSARVGRRAPVAAALTLAGLANAAVAILVFGAGAATGLPAGGSALVALATAGVGVVFAALTAVAAQVFENPRAVYGSVGLVLGAAYVLRAAGDAGNGVLSWLSPIGWGQRTFPYVEDRWWPLVLPAAATVLFVAVAVVLLDRRDFGFGLLGQRPGPASASRLLGSPLGLAWRLQRGSLIGWAFGVLVMGVAFGSIADSIEQWAADNPELADYLGGTAGIVDTYLALSIAFWALAAAAYGVSSVMRMRGEETAGRAEPVLATATSRPAWLASHLAVALIGSALVLVVGGFGLGLAYGLTASDGGQILRVTGAALAWVPAAWLVIAVAVLGFGWLPRAAAAVAWTVLGYCTVVVLFADSFDLPGWVGSVSPFSHTPDAPLERVSAAPLLAIGAIVVVLLAGGLAGVRRRDLGY
jgi:ABC-2 type transport system permease protein